MDTQLISKFWEYVEKTDTCWNWVGFLSKRGSPTIRLGIGKEYSPRRISLHLAGRSLDATRALCTCGNKLCVNPAHLVCGDEARFWSKVHKLNDCWLWMACADKNGYGKFTYRENGKRITARATRYSWYLYTGRVLPPTALVCHKCDHPPCINPEHLFIGEAQDNSYDMTQKGRQAKGERQHLAKLNDTQVKEIRELYKNGYTQAQLSLLYRISISSIGSVVRCETWKHLL